MFPLSNWGITGIFCASSRDLRKVSKRNRDPAVSSRPRWRHERRTTLAGSAGRGRAVSISAAETSLCSVPACPHIPTPRSQTPPAGRNPPGHASGWASRSVCCCVPPERVCWRSWGRRWSRSERVCEGRCARDADWRAEIDRRRSDPWLETRRPSYCSGAGGTR